MGTTRNAIYQKAKKMGVVLYNREWTEEDESELRRLWGNTKTHAIAKQLQRTEDSIKNKVIKMNLGSVLNNHVEKFSVSEICRVLGVSVYKVTVTWKKLGLKIDTVKIVQKNFRAVSTIRLLKFLKDNQDQWDHTKLEFNIFGEEPDWLVEKRIKDRENSPLNHKHKWSDTEINTVKRLFRWGSTDEEIASETNRTVGAVKENLRSEGYLRIKPSTWSNEETKFLIKNYMTMSNVEIAKELERTPHSVANRVYFLGLGKPIKRWEMNDINAVIYMFDNYKTINVISKVVKHTKYEIIVLLQDLGYKVDFDILYKKRKPEKVKVMKKRVI
jgi:hypothetical protein